MKRTYKVLLAVLLLLISGPVYAVQEPVLRVPSVEEYLAAVPTIIAESERDENILLLTYLELFRRYPDFMHQPFDPLQEIARAYRPYYSNPVSWFADHNNQQTWNTWLIEAWLRENGSQLASSDHLTFGDFEIEITRADLSGDGDDEYLLYIVEMAHYSFDDRKRENYIAYWVLQADPASGIGYRRVETPLPWFQESGYGSGGWTSGNLFTYSFQDVTGYGVNEWVVLSARFTASGFGRCQSLSVLSWQDSMLVDLIAAPLRACRNTEVLLLDQPLPRIEYTLSADEITQTFRASDTWRCAWQETETHRWDGDVFTPAAVERDFDETLNCALKAAENAIWDGDFETAIASYEQALMLPDRGSNADSAVQELRQYATARLAIAYALAGREVDAQTLITDLSEQPPASGMMHLLIDALSEAGNAVEICAAAYQVFETLTAGKFDYRDLPTNIIVGFAEEYISLPFVRLPFPRSTRAGCDITVLNPPDATPTAAPVTPRPQPTVGNPVQSTETQTAFNCGPTGTLFCPFYRELEDDERALELVDQRLNENKDDERTGFALRYRRALALESLGRSEEALAEYVAIHDAAPDSAWGMLAALHFSP